MTNNLYFLGIGGIGMSAIARYFLKEHCHVYGYDLTPSAVTDMLEKEGAVIHFDQNTDKIPRDIDFAVLTPAVGHDNIEYRYFVEHNIPVYKRSQVLGRLTASLPTLAVAGTHGKTTTTAVITHLLYPEIAAAGFIGGIAKNFGSNFVHKEHPQAVVVEADEFDRSFLTLHPSTAVVTAMDADHLDVYNDRRHVVEAFRQFAAQVTHTLIAEEDIAGELTHNNMRTYGLHETADYYAHNIDMKPNCATFDLTTPYGLLKDLRLRANGIYNVLNAIAAVAAVLEEAQCNEGIRAAGNETAVRAKLESFAGIKRRFEYVIDRPGLVYIDDYAHHPEEMKAFFTAVRRLYPQKRITGIFQPHLYSRTRDFANGFAEALNLLDEVILIPIYPAREEPIPGITARWLLGLVNKKDKRVLEKSEVIPHLLQKRPEVLLTVGAGNIDRIVPGIREAFGGGDDDSFWPQYATR